MTLTASAAAPERPARVLFIAGAGRSGSTLLACMLDQVPGIFAAGEVTYLWDRGLVEDQLCGCGEPFWSCPYWQKVADLLRERSGPLQPAALRDLWASVLSVRRMPQLAVPLLRGPGFRRRLEAYSSHLLGAYEAIRDVAECEVVVDSSKHPPEAFLLRSMRSIELSIVHLVRDSNAVVRAWQTRKLRPEIHWTTEYMPRYPVVTTALAWNAFNFAIDALRRDRRIRYMLLRYEDLTERPRESVSQVCELVGVEPGDLGFIEDNAVRLRPNHTVSGNPSRFLHGRIPVREDTSWLSSVPSAQRALVTALTLYHSRKYGYMSRRP